MIIDTHCDTATKMYDDGERLYSNRLHIDILKMKKYSGYSQFFACFTGENNKEYAFSVFKNLIDEIRKNSEHISLVKNYNEFMAAISNKKIAAFLSLEGAEPIEDVLDVQEFYNIGVRMISPTWNFDNRLAGGVLGDEKQGVTHFGKAVISEMNRLGIVCDVSHLNEKSFWDISEITRFPLVASHSNSYKVCKNKRNLTDEQFSIIAKSGGYVGINLYPPFLSGVKNAKISDVLLHIEHFLSLGGEEVIGLGCDFDGVDCLPFGISSVESLIKIFDEMQKAGYSDELIEKIAHKNCEKIIKLF